MPLPNLSNSLYVARLRHIQSIHEAPERRNPDTLVRNFLPRIERWRVAWLGQEALARLRADSFYYYLLARTRYYDRVLVDAVGAGVRQVVIVGCGTDTRAHRFEEMLRANSVEVLECDQPAAIRIKEQLAKRLGANDHIEHLPIDLNCEAWSELASWLSARTNASSLVLVEGVSPYINADPFRRFLRFLASNLFTGSLVAYDFKIRGVLDDFGRNGSTQEPFRLPVLRPEIEAYHHALGLWVDHLELSSDLTRRLLPDLAGPKGFEEDGLLRLHVK